MTFWEKMCWIPSRNDTQYTVYFQFYCVFNLWEKFLHRTYTSCIHKSTKRSKSKTKQGLFEDLEHVIAASFDPKGDSAQVATCNWNEGGVIILSAQDKLRVLSSMKENTEIEKFQLLMAYLFELAYDLAIAPDVMCRRVWASIVFDGVGICVEDTPNHQWWVGAVVHNNK